MTEDIITNIIIYCHYLQLMKHDYVQERNSSLMHILLKEVVIWYSVKLI